MNNDNLIILALSLIKKGTSFNNSYRLIAFFERKFRLNPTSALQQMRDKGFVQYELIKGVYYYYYLTETGSEFFSSGRVAALDYLEREYPEQSDILKSLLGE